MREKTVNVPAPARAINAKNGEDAANKSGYQRYIKTTAIPISSRHFRLMSLDMLVLHSI